MIAAQRPQGIAAARGRAAPPKIAATRFLRFLNGSGGPFGRGALLAMAEGGRDA